MDRTYSLLLVDDEEANRLLLTRRLEQAGNFHITQAEHGRQALNLLSVERFDLVLLDMMMPEMDGLATLDAIKSNDDMKNTPVVMLTAAKDRTSILQCLSLGAADYLIKPVNPVELKQRVRHCLDTNAPRVEPTLRLPKDSSPDARILVVDDEPLNVKLLERRLSQIGYTAVPASGGQEALEILEREPIDAVLLDIQMPEMDGFQVLGTIRASDQRRHLPVLMLSSQCQDDTIVRCFRLGANDYLVKPYHTADLHIRLAMALQLRERKRQTDPVSPTAA
jgi:CheY-like chemotaxis protein